MDLTTLLRDSNFDFWLGVYSIFLLVVGSYFGRSRY